MKKKGSKRGGTQTLTRGSGAYSIWHESNEIIEKIRNERK